MNKLQKTILNLFAVVILFFSFSKVVGLSFSPMAAFKAKEKTLLYGPSEVVKIEDFNNDKYLLGKYDDWFSATKIERIALVFWKANSFTYGIEINRDIAVNIQSYVEEDGEQIIYTYFGIINDDKIKSLILTLNSGETLEINEFYDDMFIENNSVNSNFLHLEDYEFSIKALDKNNKIIFEDRP